VAVAVERLALWACGGSRTGMVATCLISCGDAWEQAGLGACAAAERRDSIGMRKTSVRPRMTTTTWTMMAMATIFGR
jgi:hypothetical protein